MTKRQSGMIGRGVGMTGKGVGMTEESGNDRGELFYFLPLRERKK